MRPLITMGMLMLIAAGAMADRETAEQRAAKQAELDAACEAARAEKLRPIRAGIYKECMADGRSEAAYCQRQAEGYNGNQPNRAPLFYDLPECEAAFAYQRSERR